jgi:archaetidylinositol phosphate synthase
MRAELGVQGDVVCRTWGTSAPLTLVKRQLHLYGIKMTTVPRIQQNLLAANERMLLDWLCPRLPRWVSPDMMTALGFAGALMVGAGYILSGQSLMWLWLAQLGYLFNWFGDSLDGSLARYRRIERPKYGYFIDHSVDAVAILAMLGGLGLGPFVELEVALIALVAYLLLSIHTYLCAQVIDEFKLTYLAGGPTELRLMLMAMTATMFFVGPEKLFDIGLSAFDIFALIVSAILVAVFVTQTASTARLLAEREG